MKKANSSKSNMASSKAHSQTLKKTARDALEIEKLKNRILAETPEAGDLWRPLTEIEPQNNIPSQAELLTPYRFSDLALSQYTLQSLQKANFHYLTRIQHAVIPHALSGRDILAEAQTGSGKTMAFLIPIVEYLYLHQWTKENGLAALILAPTRELCTQIFDVLRTVGKLHEFSAGCIIGGKDVQAESHRINLLNIMVATPGRLSHHIDESPLWDSTSLEILAIDEADRLVDMGFVDITKSIVDTLPKSRQTMMFSATLTSSVNILASFCLKGKIERWQIGHDESATTSGKLHQSFMIVPLESKINLLFSFLLSHSQKKILLFVSACKQARFFAETFSKLKPGLAVLHLHGRQPLQKRLDIVKKFTLRQERIALFSTDLASRGIDFPSVDWVVQVDCPDTVDSYVHRVGRTARFQKSGRALLLLTPLEQEFTTRLTARKIVVQQIYPNPNKTVNVVTKMRALLAASSELRQLAQKAFTAYVRFLSLLWGSHALLKFKESIEEFSVSLGLASAPAMHFTQSTTSHENNVEQNQQGMEDMSRQSFESLHHNPMKKMKNMNKLERLKNKIRQKKLEKVKNSGVESDNCTILNEIKQDQITLIDDIDDLLIPSASKRDVEPESENRMVETGIQRKKLKFRADGSAKVKGLTRFSGNHKTFSDSSDGEECNELNDSSNEINDSSIFTKEEFDRKEEYIKQVEERIRANENLDKERDKLRVRDKHNIKRQKEKKRKRGGETPVHEDFVELPQSHEDEMNDINQNDEGYHENIHENALKQLESMAIQKINLIGV